MSGYDLHGITTTDLVELYPFDYFTTKALPQKLVIALKTNCRICWDCTFNFSYHGMMPPMNFIDAPLKHDYERNLFTG